MTTSYMKAIGTLIRLFSSLIVLTSCAPGKGLEIQQFRYESEVTDAMAEWNLYLKDKFFEGVEWQVSEGDPGEGYDGITRTSSREVIVRSDIDELQERRTLIHELGHVIGLKHSPNPKDIMYHAAQVQHVSPGDLQACQSIGECF